MSAGVIERNTSNRSSLLTQETLAEIIELQMSLSCADFELETFMNDVATRVRHLTAACGATVELLEGDDMVYSAASGMVAPYVGMRLRANASLSGLCVRSGEIQNSEDTSLDPRVDFAACQRVNAKSMMLAPLLRKDKALGVLKVVSDQTHAFDEQDEYILRLLAGILGGALGQQLEMRDQRTLQMKLTQMAQNDSLTGLPNRVLFRDRLGHALARAGRSENLFALMYMDIDHFKSVNDTHGHATGDALLQEFSRRVRATLREVDTFARLGGDEFALIAEDLRHDQDAATIAGEIVEAIRPAFKLLEIEARVSTSIGITMVSGRGLDAESLIHHADKALYAAKRAGRDRFMFAELSAQ